MLDASTSMEVLKKSDHWRRMTEEEMIEAWKSRKDKELKNERNLESNSESAEDSGTDVCVEEQMPSSNKKKKKASLTQTTDTDVPNPIPLLDRPKAAKQFRNYYMTQLTQGFGEDLDKIRKEEGFNQNKLEVLISSLESGIDIYSDLEKSLTLSSMLSD
ncbi:8369_t:CDS:2 [Paraglomus brasilianum]|uniref:Ribosome assembly protein 3 n=1 Tax=Paraglomus brasilianum TaxID=144538 RepID=A0A9N9BCN8_9GLOM|nr:8369_t:CDS:2 [Paraglomus brasilianum]